MVFRVIYTDLEKAFDKIPHKRLFMKLRNYNAHPSLIYLIECFRVIQKQCGNVNGKFLHCWGVLSGVLQGTILGRLLVMTNVNKSSAVAQMGDHGHNRHGPKRGV